MTQVYLVFSRKIALIVYLEICRQLSLDKFYRRAVLYVIYPFETVFKITTQEKINIYLKWPNEQLTTIRSIYYTYLIKF